MRLKTKGLQSLQKLLRRSKAGTTLFHVLGDYRAGRRLAGGNIETTSGTDHSQMTIAESVDYIRRVFRDYLHYADIAPEELSGKSILEVGPGDNFGVALMFLCSGASRVVALDRFYSKRDDRQQQRIYRALREELAAEFRERYDALVAAGLEGAGHADGLFRYLAGVGIENAEQVLGNEEFDLIVSRAVLEHVESPGEALSSMRGLLAPGGRLIHKVDLRDHGMYSSSGLHPLEFLTVSDRVYPAMTRNSGKPNRHLVDFYRSRLERLGFDHKILATQVIGREGEILPHRESLRPQIDYDHDQVELVQRIRPRLLDRYRALKDEDLLTSGIFFVATRRAPNDSRSAR